MSRRGVRIVVLCEDQAHAMFTRRAYLALGYHHREIRILPYPAAEGSAEQGVRREYPREAKGHRSRASYQQVVLAVIIDADRRTVEQRHAELDGALAEAGQERRAQSERIVIWIPKWHIETWVAKLRGDDVDERQNCRNLVCDADYPPAAKKFVEQYRTPADQREDTLPSISTAYNELNRLSA